MKSYQLDELATAVNFDEAAYLRANPDVAAGIASGECPSAEAHFRIFGKRERRMLRHAIDKIIDAKRRKLDRIRPLLKMDMLEKETPARHFDCLSPRLREKFGIHATDAVSANPYDGRVMSMLKAHADGLVLDCGAGRRPLYFDHVVNLEVVDYDTTDVLAAGESLPFLDESFDAVISIAVLEHVKDPFRCAAEIVRVLKPGGALVCSVPFLQPLHGFPGHFYNMTGQGLTNLFSPPLRVENLEVPDSMLPIWSLTWIIQSWSRGLVGATREDFLKMRLSDFLVDPNSLIPSPFVRELAVEKNFELASGTMLLAHKPGP